MKIRRRFALACVLIAGPVILVLGMIFIPHEYPLPSAADIHIMKASYDDHAAHATINFQVPPQHWRAIFSALQPASVDPEPAKWESLGDLQLTLKNGGSFVVELYSLSEGLGASRREKLTRSESTTAEARLHGSSEHCG